jgi:hypothetical protein
MPSSQKLQLTMSLTILVLYCQLFCIELLSVNRSLFAKQAVPYSNTYMVPIWSIL